MKVLEKLMEDLSGERSILQWQEANNRTGYLNGDIQVTQDRIRLLSNKIEEKKEKAK